MIRQARIEKGKKLMIKLHNIEREIYLIRNNINYSDQTPYLNKLNKDKRKIEIKINKIINKI